MQLKQNDNDAAIEKQTVDFIFKDLIVEDPKTGKIDLLAIDPRRGAKSIKDWLELYKGPFKRELLDAEKKDNFTAVYNSKIQEKWNEYYRSKFTPELEDAIEKNKNIHCFIDTKAFLSSENNKFIKNKATGKIFGPNEQLLDFIFATKDKIREMGSNSKVKLRVADILGPQNTEFLKMMYAAQKAQSKDEYYTLAKKLIQEEHYQPQEKPQEKNNLSQADYKKYYTKQNHDFGYVQTSMANQKDNIGGYLEHHLEKENKDSQFIFFGTNPFYLLNRSDTCHRVPKEVLLYSVGDFYVKDLDGKEIVIPFNTTDSTRTLLSTLLQLSSKNNEIELKVADNDRDIMFNGENIRLHLCSQQKNENFSTFNQHNYATALLELNNYKSNEEKLEALTKAANNLKKICNFVQYGENKNTLYNSHILVGSSVHVLKSIDLTHLEQEKNKALDDFKKEIKTLEEILQAPLERELQIFLQKNTGLWGNTFTITQDDTNKTLTIKATCCINKSVPALERLMKDKGVHYQCPVRGPSRGITFHFTNKADIAKLNNALKNANLNRISLGENGEEGAKDGANVDLMQLSSNNKSGTGNSKLTIKEKTSNLKTNSSTHFRRTQFF